MKISVVAGVVAFVAALLFGAACLVLFYLGLRSDISEVTGVYESPLAYVGLPVVLLLGVSVAFAYWKLSAARVFAAGSAVVFFGPVIFLFAAAGAPRRNELLVLLLIAASSLLANWYVASVRL